MIKIGLISDTHGHIDDKLLDFFKDVDEIWHAGDIGNISVIENLEKIKPVRAVFGNIDGQDIRIRYPEHNRFRIEDTDVWMTHIGGYPGRYDRKVKPEIFRNPPRLFISGHSHILKVIFDDKLNCLHINPGAYGKSGMHKVRTAIRFDIRGRDFLNMEILEVTR
ncbi:MAG: metallophosphoesterase family protein [Chlorobi bacterium]|nr:metallophosphoesterase family protein [Chlorobiota bacterium]